MIYLNKKYLNNRGFTLIELLVVISVISLLSSVIMVQVDSARTKAKQSRMVADMIQIRNAAELYKTDNGSYPITPGRDLSLVVPKYLASEPKNPFNNGKYSLKTEQLIKDLVMIGYGVCGNDYEEGKVFVSTVVPTGTSLINVKNYYKSSDVNYAVEIVPNIYCLE